MRSLMLSSNFICEGLVNIEDTVRLVFEMASFLSSGEQILIQSKP